MPRPMRRVSSSVASGGAAGGGGWLHLGSIALQCCLPRLSSLVGCRTREFPSLQITRIYSPSGAKATPEVTNQPRRRGERRGKKQLVGVSTQLASCRAAWHDADVRACYRHATAGGEPSPASWAARLRRAGDRPVRNCPSTLLQARLRHDKRRVGQDTFPLKCRLARLCEGEAFRPQREDVPNDPQARAHAGRRQPRRGYIHGRTRRTDQHQRCIPAPTPACKDDHAPSPTPTRHVHG